jgi:hypothetical protein
MAILIMMGRVEIRKAQEQRSKKTRYDQAILTIHRKVYEYNDGALGNPLVTFFPHISYSRERSPPLSSSSSSLQTYNFLNSRLWAVRRNSELILEKALRMMNLSSSSLFFSQDETRVGVRENLPSSFLFIQNFHYPNRARQKIHHPSYYFSCSSIF